MRLFLLIACISIGSIFANAYDFELDGIYYNYTGGNTVSVTYKGYYNHSIISDYSGDIVVPSMVFYRGETYIVTSIDDDAFYKCDKLLHVDLPNTVTTIGGSAFYSCNSLKTVHLGDSITRIEIGAFQNCDSLETINIPNSVSMIGMSSFANCKSLCVINLPEGIPYIDVAAFEGCSKLERVTIPNSVTTILDCAFRNCTSLTELVLGDSIKTIYGYAFDGCYDLSQITCKAITPPIIKDQNAFSCYSSAILKVPFQSMDSYKNTIWCLFENIVSIIGDGYVFNYNGIFYMITSENTVSVTNYGDNQHLYFGSIVIPDSVIFEDNVFAVTAIHNAAFQDCFELSDVVMPYTVTTICENAFDGCAGLTYITIPNGVTTIKDMAFQGCTGLIDLTIGSSVSFIGTKAFNYCNNLKTVNSKNLAPPVMANSNCFTNIGYKATLKVRNEALGAYQIASYWYKFSKIECMAEQGDINGDGHISISDVSVLIDLLLCDDGTSANADVNGDNVVTIADVTALIDYLLSDTWN